MKDMARVIVDARERSSVPAHLKKLGLTIDSRTIDEGDYIVAEYAIERKTVKDFLSSLYSGRLFDQAYRLGQAYKFPLMIVEGDLHSVLRESRNPKAFWGALVVLSFGYGLRIFFTGNTEETADLIAILSKHPPKPRSRPAVVVKKPKLSDVREGQIVLLQGLPGIGVQLAEQLLERFGNLRRIFLATESELHHRGGLGKAKSARIVSLLNASYDRLDRKSEQLKLSDAGP